MKLQKRLLLVFILSLTAIILVACSLFPPKVSSPTVGDVPPITASDAIPKTPHATSGAFANCITCHAAAEIRHTIWDDEYCLSCHPPAADEGGDVSLSTIILPVSHDSAAFVNCAMCHAGGLDSIPHQLDGNYADCASCHTVEYASAQQAEEPAEGEAPVDPAPAPADPTPADPAPAPTPAPADPAPAPAPPVAGPLTLSAAHAAFGDNCLMCHTDGASLTVKPIHALNSTYANCAACHAIN